MSLPRRVLPLGVHLVTRRVVGRRFLLRPSKEVNAIVKYAVVRACALMEVVLLGTTWESNHWHAVVYDPRCRLPKFMHAIDTLVARALNAHYGLGDAFWAPGSYSNQELYGNETVMDKLTYTLVNPVKDGLVERPEDWPGFRTLPEDVGTTLVAERPEGAFFGGRRPPDYEPTEKVGRSDHRRKKRAKAKRIARLQKQGKGLAPPNTKRRAYRQKPSKLPERVSTVVGIPPGFRHLGVEGFQELLREALERRLKAIYELREQFGLRHFMGVEAVLRQDPRESAGDVFPTFGLDPRISALNTVVRVQRLRELVSWRCRYREALEAWREDKSKAVFPLGTYWKRVHAGARVDEPPERLRIPA